MERTRVLIEYRNPESCRSALRLATGDHRAVFHCDSTVAPVPMIGADKDYPMSLDAADDRRCAVAGTIDRRRIKELRRDPNVIDVSFDNSLVPFDGRYGISHCDDWLVDVESPAPTSDANLMYDLDPTKTCGCLRDVATYLGADKLWRDGINGDGIVIGIVDGGIWAEGRMADRPGLVPQVIGGWPLENWGTTAGWRRHGNMVATDALGIAPRVSIYDIRISGSSPNGGRMSSAIAGIHWAIETHREKGTPQILCCGWGIYQREHDPRYASDPTHPLTRKIVEAMDEGIIVLFAAGNGGQSGPATWCGGDVGPGKSIWGANGHPRVITVGAANIEDQLIGYSSEGPAALDEKKPDFCGVSHFAGYFCSDSGTSAACAVAAGVVALLKQARPTLTQEAIKKLLNSTAKKLRRQSWSRQSGVGILQAKAAYDRATKNVRTERRAATRLECLEAENSCLRQLCIELLLERKMRADSRPC
ncbi:MAG TPA: S8 family serine peptidase [Lacipirellulaceae bacterium]|nr:S8 family serine peptidase [Lacipirellulaceae bacterium]